MSMQGFTFSTPAQGSPHSFSNFSSSTPTHPSPLASRSGLSTISGSINALRFDTPNQGQHGQDSPDLGASHSEVQARFIDALANQFGFGDHEQDLRKNLHGFAKVRQFVDKFISILRSFLVRWETD